MGGKFNHYQEKMRKHFSLSLSVLCPRSSKFQEGYRQVSLPHQEALTSAQFEEVLQVHEVHIP